MSWITDLLGTMFGGQTGSGAMNTGRNPFAWGPGNPYYEASLGGGQGTSFSDIIGNDPGGELGDYTNDEGGFWDDIKAGIGKAWEWAKKHPNIIAAGIGAAGQYLSNRERNDIMSELYGTMSGAYDWDVAQKQQVWESLAPIREKATPYFESVMEGQNPMMDILRQYQTGTKTYPSGNVGGMDAENNATMTNIPPKDTFDMSKLTQGLSPTRTSGEFKGMYDDLLRLGLGRKMFEAKPFQAPPMGNYSLMPRQQEPVSNNNNPPPGNRDSSMFNFNPLINNPGGNPPLPDKNSYMEVLKQILARRGV